MYTRSDAKSFQEVLLLYDYLLCNRFLIVFFYILPKDKKILWIIFVIFD